MNNQTLTTKYFQDIYPALSDKDKILYVDNMYRVSTGLEAQSTLPTALRTGKKLKVFHLRQRHNTFNVKEYMADLMVSPRGYIRIIALYLIATKVKFHTQAIANSVIHRHSGDAKKLEPWLDSEETKQTLKMAIIDTAKHAEDNDYQFTLQTVYKKLTS